MTKAEMLRRISSLEIAEWMAFSSIEPFGELRADIRSAMIACTMANLWRGQNQAPFKITDFMITYDNKKEQTVEEMKQILRQFTAASGGRIIS